MNNQLQIFKNENFGQVRTLIISNKPYFVGKDIAEILGYRNPTKAVSTHCKGVSKMGIPSNGGIQEMSVIPEGDIYRLIIKSKLPKAQEFESWVMDGILPQIRKTGGYIPIEEQMDDEEFMARALEVAHRTLKKKEEILKAKTEELEEKNRFMKQISASSNSILVRDVAHLATKQNIKIGEKRLWNKLREWGLIQKGSTKPMQRALEQGLFEKSEFVIQRSNGIETKFTTKVTGKGQIYIINKLIKESKLDI